MTSFLNTRARRGLIARAHPSPARGVEYFVAMKRQHGRLDEAAEAWGRSSRDPDGSMSWGSVGRGDEVFWGTLFSGWAGVLVGALGVAGLIALLVWLF